MPDLLLELFSEEIPARMQRRASEDLKSLLTNALVEAGLTYEGAKAFATPRRLALHIAGLPAGSKPTREERKGPRVGAPEKAVEGFLRGAGLASVEEAEIVSDPKKGDFYVARIEKPGRSTPEIIAEVMPGIIRNFPWPKSMRWGEGSLRWVRPLHSIVCMFGPETEEPEVVPFEVDGIRSGDLTSGHRFLAPETFTVRRLEDYMSKLEAHKVVLDSDRRKDIILHDARDRALALGLELVEDEGLLEEVAGLVEWPVVLVGSFDESFLEIPDEATRLTIRANQKCFVLKDPATGKLANKFVLTSNIEASDGGQEIIHGNEKVIRARLSDAKFFWDTDLKSGLVENLPKLENIVFHEKLGTVAERVERLKALARDLAPVVGADPSKAERAALLCKADLVSQMVYEFPELQGLMGRTYAALQGEDASVAAAIEDHYKPQGPSDRTPTDKVAATLAMADKLDLLIGFWIIDEKPTGSKDPFALRRAALGLIRIILENDISLSLLEIIKQGVAARGADLDEARVNDIAVDLCRFLEDRLSVQLRGDGVRHDLLSAVTARQSLATGAKLPRIIRRLEALDAFVKTDDGANLMAGAKRAANIVAAESKKSDGADISGTLDESLLIEAAEKSLNEAVGAVRQGVKARLAVDDFTGAMQAISALREPIDSFFEDIMVNVEDEAIRRNRLRLLAQINEVTGQLADFSVIEG